MAKRLKLKNPRLSVVPMVAVHDRKAVDLTHKDVAPIEVDDPLEAGGRLIVMRTLRDDPLAQMHARHQIDNCQYLAGRHWQKAHELAEIGGAKAIDYERAKVDGGQIPQPTISDGQAVAFRDLAMAHKELGAFGASVVYDVLARRLTIVEVAESRNMTRQKERDFLGDRLRECLDTMAIIFGYAMKPT